MLCLTLSSPSEQLGVSGPDGFRTRSDLQIAYVPTTQPSGCSSNQYILLTQSEITTLTGSVTDLQKGLTLKVQPYEAQTDDYAAISSIFALGLAAGAVVWGMKRVLKLLRNPSEA